MRLGRFGIAGALACSMWSGALRAEDGGTAQALFDKGVADLEAGRPESACPAFAESQRLDPRPGTLFALADCEVDLRKTASALGHYQEYLGWVSRLTEDQQQRHAERVDIARARVEALQPVVPTLTLAVSATAPQGMVVERDGVLLQGAALGVALPIDPGEHVIVARAPGVPEERLTVELTHGESKRIELPFRPAPPPAALPPPAPPTTEPTARPKATGRAADEESSPSQRTWGYVAAGVGTVGLFVGAITGALVLNQKAIVDAECKNAAGGPDRNSCTPRGKDAADNGKSLAAVSTIAFAVGIAGVGTGLTLVLTAPDDANRRATWLGVTRRF